ncbi:MAG: 2-oxoglutarate dehydrogenase complex dihydrolipoyllysine-residue succinyltransferase [Rhodopirellula sp.]|nr:2-oxoglutarate dehydrogenase complex dihydrolipoyllysine-residue succinyltransferase [Rhodopirellula sp.]
MAVEVKVPAVGESVLEVQISQWLKQEGERVEKDDDLVEIESEKATVTVPAPAAGALVRILKKDGEFANVGDLIAELDESAAGEAPVETKPQSTAAAVATPPPASESNGPIRVMPAAERVLAEHGLRAEQVPATGPGGRVLKEDVERFLAERPSPPPAAEPASATIEPETTIESPTADREEDVVPMSMIRRAIAKRLVEAQQTAALLTTFNEVDMSEVMALRKKYGEPFKDRHGVKLGFMSFFIKAAIEGLKRFPQVNAEIRGRNVVYRNYYDIGVAIGGGKGLVVPILRNAERMSFADIERSIAELAVRARENKIDPEELEGGTFTISNGGVYGSMLSTPIVNPPQSGVLGLHAIQDRPVAREGQVVIRPMMYLALTYDHRIVDGREAVTFLRTIKDVVEDPARLLLEF